jgi:hypothetical protein
MEKKMIIGAIGAEAADGLMLEFRGWLGKYLDGQIYHYQHSAW